MFWQFAFTSQTEGIALHSSISMNAKRNAFKTLIIHRRYIVKRSLEGNTCLSSWGWGIRDRKGFSHLKIASPNANCKLNFSHHCLKLKNSKIILSGPYFAIRIKRNNFYVTFSKLTL